MSFAIRKFYKEREGCILFILLISMIGLFLALLLSENAFAWDHETFLKINALWDPSFETICRIFAEMGSFFFWFIVIFILWLIGKREMAIYLLIAILIHIAVGGTLKYVVDRPRPFEILENVHTVYQPADPSFPSGHTEGSFAAATVLGRKSSKLILPLSFFAIIVGFGRIYYGVHWPLDVIGGAVIGIFIGLIASTFKIDFLKEKMESGWKRFISSFSFKK
ncbi:MAG: phosphatase PAP2 family protein [Methanomassiliicoccales archaeon]|nr:phosphatase PAP2 family protein [Methanomassiliicoccales archaeon]